MCTYIMWPALLLVGSGLSGWAVMVDVGLMDLEK